MAELRSAQSISRTTSRRSRHRQCRFEVLGALGREKIESENRLTIEAVNTRADQIERKFEDGFEKMDARFEVIEAVMRENGSAIQELRKDVAKLVPLEDRVIALERRPA